MKILIVNDYTERIGGAEIFVNDLKDNLIKKGHKAELFGLTKNDKPSSYLERWHAKRWAKKLKEKIAQFHPDIIHINNVARVLSTSVIKEALNSNIPTIITFHDVYFLNEEKPHKNLLTKILKTIKTQFHLSQIKNQKIVFTAPSKYLANKMQKALKIPVKTIYNGVTIPRTATKYEKIILYVGHISKGKNLAPLCPMLNALKDHKTIVLGDGELKNVLAKKFPKIDFQGFKDPTPFYKKASILIYPSRLKENFPLSTIEAMSYGLVPIASSVGGLPEQIKEGKTGYLFSPNNPEEFKHKLLTLLKKPNQIKEIGKAARVKVKKEFDKDKIINQYIELYNKIKNDKQ